MKRRPSLEEGRKIVSLRPANLEQSQQKIGNRVNTYNPFNSLSGNKDVRQGASELKRDPAVVRDYSYGIGSSRNHHLNAIVRHILPSFGKLLNHSTTYFTGHMEGEPRGLSSRMGEFSSLGYQGAVSFFNELPKDHPHRIIWDEYHRHISDLADHIDKHTKRMAKKITPVYNPVDFYNPAATTKDQIKRWDLQTRLATHDTADHRGKGFDPSQLGEIMAVHGDPDAAEDKSTKYTPLLHPEDQNLPVISKPRLRAMLDRFYRGGNWLRQPRASMDPVSLPPLHHPDDPLGNFPSPINAYRARKAMQLISASRKMGIPQGWKTRGSARIDPKPYGPKPYRGSSQAMDRADDMAWPVRVRRLTRRFSRKFGTTPTP
jgi:hypothetical protein